VSRLAALALTVAALTAAPALAPAAANAHGLVGRADLPIPVWLFGWAAAVVLVVSFVALASLWPRPRLQTPRLRPLVGIPSGLDVLAGAVGVALFALVVYSGYEGTKIPTANLAPTFIYVYFWVGLVVLSVLLGDVFRALNPWLALGRTARWLIAHRRDAPPPPLLSYPSWLGRWPAVISITAFAWLELAYPNKDDPATLATLSLAYAIFQVAGMVLFGVERWSERGDGFGVYFNLYSRLSPLQRNDGRLCLRAPLSGAPPLPVMAGTVALMAVAIGSTSFDGFSNGPMWALIAPDLKRLFMGLGASDVQGQQWAATLGLVGFILLIGAIFRLGVRGMQTVGEGHSADELAGRFAHTLIPIAFAYVLAHYFSLLVFQGQAAGYLIYDPLGGGSGLFARPDFRIDFNLISATAIWYVQVGALLTGHVAGLTLAHDRAVALYHNVRAATRSQYWMLVVMVGFTSLGLWLLSAVQG